MNDCRHRWIVVIVVGVLVWWAQSVSATGITSVGLVVSVIGDVTIARGKGPHPAVEGFVLQPGDTVTAKMGATCSGFGLDGAAFSLKGPGQLVLAPPSKSGSRNRILAWISQQLAQWSGQSRSKALVSRAVRDWKRTDRSPSLILPASDGSVRSGESRFYWSTTQGIDLYAITIARDNGEGLTHTVRGHKFVQDDLEPGMTYVWKVDAETDELHLVSEWRSFRVLSPDDEEQLDEALETLSDVDAGVLLLSVGLHGEAIQRFDVAIDSGNDRRSALRWRARLFAEIGLHKDAYEDLVESTIW